MAATITKKVHLSEERAKRLSQLATKRGTTEDAVIAQALDMLIDMNVEQESEAERAGWSALSAPSLNRIWDNEADAVYDNWKELYGLPQG